MTITVDDPLNQHESTVNLSVSSCTADLMSESFKFWPQLPKPAGVIPYLAPSESLAHGSQETT